MQSTLILSYKPLLGLEMGSFHPYTIALTDIGPLSLAKVQLSTPICKWDSFNHRVSVCPWKRRLWHRERCKKYFNTMQSWIWEFIGLSMLLVNFWRFLVIKILNSLFAYHSMSLVLNSKVLLIVNSYLGYTEQTVLCKYFNIGQN